MSVTKRTPDEIMAVIDQAQDRLGDEFDLPSLVWEVIGDVIDSVDLAVKTLTDQGWKADGEDLEVEITDTVRDYVGNHYGDL